MEAAKGVGQLGTGAAKSGNGVDETGEEFRAAAKECDSRAEVELIHDFGESRGGTDNGVLLEARACNGGVTTFERGRKGQALLLMLGFQEPINVSTVFPGGDAVDGDAGITEFGEFLHDGGVAEIVAEHGIDVFADVEREAGDFAVAGGKGYRGIYDFRF